MLITIRRSKLEDLEKARHIARAPAGGLEHAAGSWRGGQFIPRTVLAEQQQRAEDAMPDLIGSFRDRMQFLREVYEQQAALAPLKEQHPDLNIPVIPFTTVEWRMKAAIRECYSRAAVLGRRAAGDLTSMDAAGVKALQKLRYDEFGYLKGFGQAMQEGTGAMPYEERMEMYCQAIREAYWLGFVLALPPSAQIAWRRGATSDSCRDCERFEAHGPYTVMEFRKDVLGQGYLPQGGKLACLGAKCRCWLQVQEHGRSRMEEQPAWVK